MQAKRKLRKHGVEIRLKAVELHNQGDGIRTISTKLSVSKAIIEHWLNLFKAEGIAGLTIRKNNNQISSDLKQELVYEVLENKLSKSKASLRYHVSITSIYVWVNKVKKHGYSSLAQNTSIEKKTKNMGSPKKKEPETEIEKLQAEVEYLKAENAYLKKLQALVEARVNRESGKKSKPSNH